MFYLKTFANAKTDVRHDNEANGLLTKRPSDNFIAVRIVKSYGINYISVPFKGKKLVASDRIPYFACPVITTRDELVTRLVESTIR